MSARVLPAARVLRFDTFELDLHAGELRKGGVRLRLQGQPVQILAILLQSAGNLVTREDLRSQLWSADTFVDFDHGLHNAVARIREVLGDSAETPRYIETLPRRGYRFIARVDEVKPDEVKPDKVRPEDSLHPLPSRGAVDPHGVQALAVLPLEDLSGEPAHDYFADGMTEALITSLAKIKSLRVISRTSAMQYKGVRRALPQIARELNVDAVIEGSVLRSGDRIRITAQLIHAPSDQHLWAESYERDFRDILTLQSEIARQVADEVKIILTPEETARLASTRQINPEAHEFYLKARFHWNKRTEDSVKNALSYFHWVIECDPTYAQGHAGIADVYAILGYYNALAPGEAYPKAKAAALKALELDDCLAESHATLGIIKRDFEWDWTGAEQEFQRAIELNPGLAEAYHWRGTLFSMLGRHAEGVREKMKALTIDPLSVAIRADLARMHYFARDYDRALEQYRAALALDPNFGYAHLGLAHAYQQKGLLQEAVSELEMGVHLSGEGTYALARLGHGYALAKRTDEAHSVLNRLHTLSAEKYVSAYDIAMIHVALQDINEAFAWLDRAFEERSLWLGYLNVEPQLDSLRSDRRFPDLLQRVGLEN